MQGQPILQNSLLNLCTLTFIYLNSWMRTNILKVKSEQWLSDIIRITFLESFYVVIQYLVDLCELGHYGIF